MKNAPVFGEVEIEEVLTKARACDKQIGTYTKHTIKDDDYYSVTVTNGRILLFTGEIKDRHKLLNERVYDIAARFHYVGP